VMNGGKSVFEHAFLHLQFTPRFPPPGFSCFSFSGSRRSADEA
jgi:hypothetical protein